VRALPAQKSSETLLGIWPFAGSSKNFTDIKNLISQDDFAIFPFKPSWGNYFSKLCFDLVKMDIIT
jgi:hypothetical protein